jgi:DNA polymerase-3 subunit delta
MALNHALMLRRLAVARQAGGFDTAFRNERVFFRRQDRVRNQSQTWDQRALTRAIDTLAVAQEQSRRTPALEDAIAIRALWSIALAARR